MNNINFLDYFELETWFLPSSSTVSRAPSSWSRKSLASEMGNANVLTISTPKIKKQRCTGHQFYSSKNHLVTGNVSEKLEPL